MSGVPVVLVAGPQDAAVELIRQGGGVVVAHADPEELAEAIVGIITAGEAARAEALANAERLCRERSVTESAWQLLEMARHSRREGP
jgi:glycosyltransferase involved in cell wall biosynthesis